MKNHLFRLIIFVTVLTPCSISCSKINSPSNFLNSFSLGETIKRLNVQGIDLSTGSVSSSASAGDPSPYRHEFDQEIIIQQPMVDRFDEIAFLAKLQEEITQEAADSGVKVNGGGTLTSDQGGNSFHINYHSGKHYGGIEVIGVRTEKNKYRVWCIIRELAPNDARKN